MLQFIVIVHEQSVVVQEQIRPLMMYEISAIVDGEIWRYHIVKMAGTKLNRGWRERGNQQAFYHAKNSGTHVKFKEVHYVKTKSKSKIHPDHKALF